MNKSGVGKLTYMCGVLVCTKLSRSGVAKPKRSINLVYQTVPVTLALSSSLRASCSLALQWEKRSALHLKFLRGLYAPCLECIRRTMKHLFIFWLKWNSVIHRQIRIWPGLIRASRSIWPKNMLDEVLLMNGVVLQHSVGHFEVVTAFQVKQHCFEKVLRCP